MGSVIVLVSRDERPLVRAQAHRLHRVAVRVPGVSRRLRRRTCVHVAAIAPELASDRLALLLRHALWSYWLDNLLDAAGVDVAAAARLRKGIAVVTAGDEVHSADSLLVELAHMRCELSRFDPTGDVVVWYGKALRDTMAAEVDRLRARVAETGTDPTPTADQYLATAAHTANYRSFAYALLAARGDLLTAEQLRCIDSALWSASRAVRLANDVASLVRDGHTGTVNVLWLRTAAGEAVTTSYVWSEVGRQVRAHDAAMQGLARLGAVPEEPVRALIRSLAQSIRLYRHTDLR